MNYQKCSDCHTTEEPMQLEYKFVFPDLYSRIKEDINMDESYPPDPQNLSIYQHTFQQSNLVTYFEQSDLSGTDCNENSQKRFSPDYEFNTQRSRWENHNICGSVVQELEQPLNDRIQITNNLLEETKEPLMSIKNTQQQDDGEKSSEAINNFSFVSSSGDTRLIVLTIAELGMTKRKDVVLKSLLRKI